MSWLWGLHLPPCMPALKNLRSSAAELLLCLTAAHPTRFTPSCFWNALSVCRKNVKVSNALGSSSRQLMAFRSHLFRHLVCFAADAQ
jgi:hypothetical protein